MEKQLITMTKKEAGRHDIIKDLMVNFAIKLYTPASNFILETS